jgi:hypothetical protein
MYERTVAAALAETTSKFRLAEALARDIPPMRGRDADTADRLAEARQAIIDAGGEERTVATLADYRLTAQWVILPTSGEFGWVPGASYSAHREARMLPVTRDEFAAMQTRTVDAIRRRAGKPGTDGPPERVVGTWTREERVRAAREILASEPDMAETVIEDATTRSQVRGAIERNDARVRPRPAPPGGGGEEYGSPLNLVWEFRQLHKAIDRIAAEVARRGSIVSEAERDALVEEVAWLRSALGMIEDGIRGGSVDAALANILRGGS